LGALDRRSGNLEQARATIEAALRIAREIGYAPGLANALNHLGLVASVRGDDAAAAEYFGESLALHQQLGDRYAESILLNNLGDNARRRGDLEAAIRFAETSLLVVREIGSQDGVAAELVNLAEIHLEQGEAARAATLASEAVRILTEIGNRDYLAPALFVLGDALMVEGDERGALAAHQQALQVNERLGERAALANGLDRVAGLAGGRGDWQAAVRLLAAAAALRGAVTGGVSTADRTRHEQMLAAARNALGGDRFAALLAAGRQLPPETAIAEALAVSLQSSTLVPSPSAEARGGEGSG
jgi:tetratricopeptide (TPR) repeat protein